MYEFLQPLNEFIGLNSFLDYSLRLGALFRRHRQIETIRQVDFPMGPFDITQTLRPASRDDMAARRPAVPPPRNQNIVRQPLHIDFSTWKPWLLNYLFP